MALLTLQLLGGFSARLGGSGQALNLGTKKAQALLAYLALPVGRAHPRDKLAGLLWGDTGDEQARQSLRQTLVALRRALPASKPPILVVDRDALALAPAAVEVDVQAFERLCAESTSKALAQAVSLYHGELLEGFRVTEEPFEDWLRAERARLRERALDVLIRLLALQSKTGETERAVHTAARLLALDPVQEAVHRALMRLYARQGRRAEALRQYQVCVGALQRELRAEPEAETKHLYRGLLQQTALPVEASHATAGPAARRRKAAGSRPEAPAPEGRLVGRVAEMARVREAWAAAKRGHGQVVVIAGEAGIGKSRLLAEMAAEAAWQGGRVLLGRCYESEQILPFGPWVDAFRSGGVIADEALLEALNPVWRAELGRLIPEVAVVGGPVPTDDRLRLFDSVMHLVERLGATQPTVLGLEDLHWADEMSVRLLPFVARRLRRAAVLLVATARDDEPGSGEMLRVTVDELGREAHCVSLTLSPLSRADTAALVQTLAQKDDDSAAAARVEQIWAISEGNPFVVAEAMRALQEGAMPPGSSTNLALPARVREVITRRIERLSAQGQELAATAAVIGREFEFALLQRASGLTEREVAHGVEELVRRRILHGVGERLDFTHDRIRETVATGSLAPRRKVLHAQVAAAIEDLYADRVERLATALGRHCLHAEAWDKAAGYLLQAGTVAGRGSAHREAVVCLNQALAALDHLPRSRDTSERAVDIRLELHHALFPLPERGLVLDHLREAERLAVELDDQPRLGRVLAPLANEWWFLGGYESAVETGERALAIGTALGDVRIKVMARSPLGRAHHSLGNFGRAKSLYEDSLRELGEVLKRESFGIQVPPYVESSFRLAWTLVELGEFAEGLARAEEAAEICHSLTNWFGLAHALFTAGLVHFRRGDFQSAIPVLEQGIELCRSREFPVLMLPQTAHLGYAYTLAGPIAKALPLLEQSVREAERLPMAWSQSLWSGWWAEALLLAGRADDAAALGRRALDLAVHRKERGQEAYARRVLGEIASREGGPALAEAARHYSQAMSLAAELGMRPLITHCHFGLGKLHRGVGERQEAREHLTIAATMYREMDMRFWPEQAQAELAEAG